MNLAAKKVCKSVNLGMMGKDITVQVEDQLLEASMACAAKALGDDIRQRIVRRVLEPQVNIERDNPS